jgi:3-hydroxyisobutyrate dehydrogenase/2-hydroxy-3-oxopropionate reductase
LDQARDRAGLIGAGRMGRAIVKHLVASGFTVTVTDTSREAAEAAKAQGAAVAATPALVAAAAEVVFVAVGYDREVAEVCRGDQGILSAAPEGGVVVVNSTASPSLVRELGADAASKGVGFLDAPIARGARAADAGTLLALVGGEAATLERVRPMLQAFCSDIAHLGEVGHGQVAKAINNLLLWVNGAALIEAGRLAASTGIDLPGLREALLLGSGRSFALENWEHMTYTWALKDMQIVMEMCDRAGLSLPLLGHIKEQVKAAREIKRRGEVAWTR